MQQLVKSRLKLALYKHRKLCQAVVGVTAFIEAFWTIRMVCKLRYSARFVVLMALILGMVLGQAEFASSETSATTNALLVASQSDRAATKLAVQQLVKSHVSHHEIDEELYRRTLDRVLWTLDPRQMFFVEADVKPFYDDASTNAKALREGDPSFAFRLSNLWLRRVSERLPTIVDLSNRPLVDTETDLPILELADLNFASDNHALHERCRQWLRCDQQVLRQSGVPLAEIQSQLIDRYRSLLPSKTEEYWVDVRAVLLDSLAHAYDKNSRYFSEEHLCYLNPRWKREEVGIGLSLHWRNGSLTVREVFPGSLAFRDGQLRRGDKILAFSLHDDGNVVLPAQVQHTNGELSFKGKIGSAISLVVLPCGETSARNYRIVRAKTPTPKHVTGAILSGDQLPSDPSRKLGYIRLSSFFLDIQNLADPQTINDSTSHDLKLLLTSFNKQGVDVVLLDLRVCNSGSASEVLNVAGLFVGDRPIVQAKVPDKEMAAYSSENVTCVWNGPLLVLTNRRTREMGELLAGALKDNQRALVVGEATFGDGCLSTLFELWSTIGDQVNQERLGALSVTSVAFFRPSGQGIQARGVKPHIVLPLMEHPADRSEQPLLVDMMVDSVVTAKGNDAFSDKLLLGLRTESERRRSTSAYFRGELDPREVIKDKVIAGVPYDDYLKEAVSIAVDYCKSIQ